MNADKKIKSIFENYHKIILSCEKGIIEDTDPIYLHDFRVSLRKTRSLLKQFKHYISDESFDFAVKLKKIANETNHLRDLDVFIFSKDQYRSLVPSEFQTGLDTFFDELERHKNSELKKVYKLIHSKIYEKTNTGWEKIYSSEKSILKPDIKSP